MFHNSKVFVSCFINILYTECAKLKKNNSGSERVKGRTRLEDTGVNSIVLSCESMGLAGVYLLPLSVRRISVRRTESFSLGEGELKAIYIYIYIIAFITEVIVNRVPV